MRPAPLLLRHGGSWPQGKTWGTVKNKLTSRTEVGDQTVAASEDDPRYLIESKKSER